MTITFVAAGAAVTGNNAPLNPPAPAGVQAGDLVVIPASIRNSGTGSVNTPDGWEKNSIGNLAVLSRIWQPADAMPTVTFGSGAANADTIAQALAFRGVSTDQVFASAGTTQLNGSAQNIAYPALTIDSDNFALLMFLWKQDDASAYSTPAGWTAVGMTSTTTGDDASIGLYYQIQTTATDISSGSVTVTGGASAISRAFFIGVKQAAAITAVEQDAYPPRVLVSVTGLTIGDDVQVYRSVAGVRTLVRAGEATDVTDPAFLVLDAELPFDIPVSYIATVGSAEYATAPVTYGLPGGKVALSDAVTGLSAEVVISAWPSKPRTRDSTVFAVGGRNVVVSGELGMFGESNIELTLDQWSSVENVLNLVENATEGVVQIRRPLSVYEGVDAYVSVLNVDEQRYSQDGSDPRRKLVLSVVETESWPAELEAIGFTYADLEALYTGLTYVDLRTDYATYLDLAQADLTP